MFANSEAKGHVVIISEDGDQSDPDDLGKGGVLIFEFDPPRWISSMGLLDNEKGALFVVTTSDGGSTSILTFHGGDNAFEEVGIGKPSVEQIEVHFSGSGAITDISSCPP